MAMNVGSWIVIYLSVIGIFEGKYQPYCHAPSRLNHLHSRKRKLLFPTDAVFLAPEIRFGLIV
jgi:hypothetical protein